MTYRLGTGLVCNVCHETFSSVMSARHTRYLAQRVDWKHEKNTLTGRMMDVCPNHAHQSKHWREAQARNLES